jgi:hypothetical protein
MLPHLVYLPNKEVYISSAKKKIDFLRTFLPDILITVPRILRQPVCILLFLLKQFKTCSASISMFEIKIYLMNYLFLFTGMFLEMKTITQIRLLFN